MRISDWSSDVCSSDLSAGGRAAIRSASANIRRRTVSAHPPDANGKSSLMSLAAARKLIQAPRRDRKSVEWGKSVSVRVDLGGRRIIKKTIQTRSTQQHYIICYSTHHDNKQHKR